MRFHACRPISIRGTDMVVSGGAAKRDCGMSSMPTIESCSGTSTPDLAQAREQAERDEVVERDRGGRAGLEHGVGGVVARLHAGAGRDGEDLEVGVLAGELAQSLRAQLVRVAERRARRRRRCGGGRSP